MAFIYGDVDRFRAEMADVEAAIRLIRSSHHRHHFFPTYTTVMDNRSVFDLHVAADQALIQLDPIMVALGARMTGSFIVLRNLLLGMVGNTQQFLRATDPRTEENAYHFLSSELHNNRYQFDRALRDVFNSLGISWEEYSNRIYAV